MTDHDMMTILVSAEEGQKMTNLKQKLQAKSDALMNFRQAREAFDVVAGILVQQREALEKISVNKTMTLLTKPQSDEYCDGANAGFCSQAEISDEALAATDEALKRMGIEV